MPWPFSIGALLGAVELDAVTKPNNAVCQVRMAAPMSLTNNTTTTLLFDTEDVDPLAWHSTSSNTGRITPTILGWYVAFVGSRFTADTDYLRAFIEIRKNGTSLTPLERTDLQLPWPATSPSPQFTTGGQLISLNGSTDYIDVAGLQNNTSAAANTIDAVFNVRLVYPT